MRFFICLLLIICSACAKTKPKMLEDWTQLPGRGHPLTYVYRVKAPQSWTYHAPIFETLSDTTKPIGEFVIDDGKESVLITIHNFPSVSQKDRIPPQAQISRWQRQFENLDSSSMNITPQSFSGFVGMLFEGTGSIKGDPASMLAWSMQLAPEHYLTLQYPYNAAQAEKFPCMCADITIKAVGSPEMIQQYKDDIVQFARTLELIEEIPVRH